MTYLFVDAKMYTKHIKFWSFFFVLLLTGSLNSTKVGAKITEIEQDFIDDGIIHHRFVKQLDRGPVVVNVLEIDTSNGYVIKPALANPSNLWSKAILSTISQREHALAAVNATYFAKNGMPIGCLAINGEWITAPNLPRASAGIDSQGKVHFDKLLLRGEIKVLLRSEGYSELPYEITNINQPTNLDSKGISFFNHWWQQSVSCGNGRTCLFVTHNGEIKKKVYAYEEELGMFPNDSDYVLSTGDSEKFQSLSEGGRISIEWRSSPDWSNMINIIGGGPHLLKEGRIVLDQESEKFTDSSGIGGTAPRTALGITSPNRLILLTADGRSENSVGVSLYELARLLKSIGVIEAINLDGGGSTTMVINGKIVNQPSDKGGPRQVSTGLFVIKQNTNNQKTNAQNKMLTRGGPSI